MLLTEEEARNKWCPMVRFITFPPTSTYGEPSRENNRDGSFCSQCIASECMWWKQSLDEERGYCGVIK